MSASVLVPKNNPVSANLDLVYKKWEHKVGLDTRPSTGNYKANTDAANQIIQEGKEKWRSMYGGTITPNRHRPARKHRQNNNAVPGVELTSIIAQFKTKPIVSAEDIVVSRPLMGQCCSCLPESKRDFFSQTTAQQGIRDVLQFSTNLEYKYLYERAFNYAVYVLRMKHVHKYRDVSVAVLASSRVRDAIETERKKGRKNAESKCVRLLTKMKAKMSKGMLKCAAWFLCKFLPYFFHSIQIHAGQLQMVHQAAKRGVPVVYIPLHRSHLDYILVQYVLYMHNIRCPHIAAGDNLNIPFFGWLMRSLGAFFIRRKLDKHAGKKDVLYRATLHSYILELLRNGESFKFFIEGGRTRSGKPKTPKGGLMSVVVNAVTDEVIEDAYIVPVSINYEKILEGNFSGELMGLAKKKETFFGTLAAAWSILRCHFGCVRVEFAQPFSLKEYLMRNQPLLFRPSTPSSGEETSSDDQVSQPFKAQRSGSMSSLYGTDVVNEEQRQVVKSLAEHVTYTCQKSSPVMSTNMVAFLLLTKHRKGVSKAKLIQSFDWLKEELKTKCQDVAFQGNSGDVIDHAISLLGHQQFKIKYSDDTDDIEWIQPILSLPTVFEFSYYSNTLAPSFLLESIIVCSLLYNCDIDLYGPVETMISDVCSTRVCDLLETATDFCQLLKYEFILLPPCSDVDEVYREVIYSLSYMDILQVQTDEDGNPDNSVDGGWAKRFSKTVSWEDDDADGTNTLEEQYVKVNALSPECRPKIKFYHSVLAPYLEGYLVTARYINSLTEEMCEADFMKSLQEKALNRAKTGLAVYNESVSSEILYNALKAFQDLRIVDSYFAGNLRMVELHDHFEVKDKLKKYISLLEALQE